MKKFYTIPLLLLFLAACQQTPINTPDVSEGETIVQEGDVINNLCADGSLDCIPDTSGHVYTSTDAFLVGMYNDCLISCLNNAESCTNIPATFMPTEQSEIENMTYQTINADANAISCGNGIINSCQDTCYDNVYGPDAQHWSSDQLEWPENALVVEATIRTCIDGKNRTAMQFAGATAKLNNYYRANHVLCGQGGIDNKAVVKFTPFQESTYVLHGQAFSTTSFPISDSIEKKHRGWEVTPFGVPKTYTTHMDVGQGRWLVRKIMSDFGNIDVTNDGFHVKWEYVSESRDLGYPLTNIFFKKWGQALLGGGMPMPQGVEIIMLFVAPPKP